MGPFRWGRWKSMPLSPVTRHGLFPVPPSPAVTRLHLPQEETKADKHGHRGRWSQVGGGGGWREPWQLCWGLKPPARGSGEGGMARRSIKGPWAQRPRLSSSGPVTSCSRAPSPRRQRWPTRTAGLGAPPASGPGARVGGGRTQACSFLSLPC